MRAESMASSSTFAWEGSVETGGESSSSWSSAQLKELVVAGSAATGCGEIAGAEIGGCKPDV
jgi:hypothetical protein